MSDPILFFDLKSPARRLRADIEKRLMAILDHGQYIGGPEVTGMEVSDAPSEDDPSARAEALHQAVLQSPDNEDARFDYVKLLLQLGQHDAA